MKSEVSLIAINKKDARKILSYELKRLCSSAFSPLFLLRWLVSKDRSLFFTPNPKEPLHSVVVSFEDNDNIIGLASYDASSILNNPYYIPLSEDIVIDESKEKGFEINRNWFIERNARLSIMEDIEGNLIAPAVAFNELTCQYIFSSLGYVRVVSTFKESSLQGYYILNLIFLGASSGHGWKEKILFSKEEVDIILNGRSGALFPLYRTVH